MIERSLLSTFLQAFTTVSKSYFRQRSQVSSVVRQQTVHCFWVVQRDRRNYFSCKSHWRKNVRHCCSIQIRRRRLGSQLRSSFWTSSCETWSQAPNEMNYLWCLRPAEDHTVCIISVLCAYSCRSCQCQTSRNVF